MTCVTAVVCNLQNENYWLKLHRSGQLAYRISNTCWLEAISLKHNNNDDKKTAPCSLLDASVFHIGYTARNMELNTQ